MKMIKNIYGFFFPATLLSLCLLLLSCEDNNSSINSDDITFWGTWESEDYSYYINSDCTGNGLTFDEYIANIIEELQLSDATLEANQDCAWYGQEWCNATPSTVFEDTDTIEFPEDYIDCELANNYECVIANELNTIVNNWTIEEEASVVSDNTIIANPEQAINLVINANMTFSVTYDGVCLDHENYSQGACTAIDGAEWNSDLNTCMIISDTVCIEIADGTWDDGYEGTWDENGDFHILQWVDADMNINQDIVIFNGEEISMIVHTADELCVTLKFID